MLNPGGIEGIRERTVCVKFCATHQEREGTERGKERQSQRGRDKEMEKRESQSEREREIDGEIFTFLLFIYFRT